MIHWLETHLSPCLFKSTLGVDCPGCGMQRALISLLKGNFSESLQYHPALIPFLITLLLVIIQIKLQHPKGAKYIMVMFIITSAITVINFSVKQYLFLSQN